jgi:hypothetical protein
VYAVEMLALRFRADGRNALIRHREQDTEGA